MSLIELTDVRKVYMLDEVEVHALRGVSVSIERGEYVALMGPSGSGKSTLMNTLGCLDRPTDGSYLLDGEEVTSMSRDARARAEPADRIRLPELQPVGADQRLENVELPLLYSPGVSAGNDASEPSTCSARWAWPTGWAITPANSPAASNNASPIARALVNNPSILMADEPTGNLDSRTSKEVIQLLRDLNEDSEITIILVTHDQDIGRNAKRTLVLRDGWIVEDTTDFSRAVAALHTHEHAPVPAPHDAASAVYRLG